MVGFGGWAVVDRAGRSDFRTGGGVVGMSGTTYGDFAAARSAPGPAGAVGRDSGIRGSLVTIGSAVSDIGGTTPADFGASCWLFVAGLFPSFVRTERWAPFAPSAMMSLFPVELRLMTSFFPSVACSRFCAGPSSGRSSTITRAPGDATAAVLTARTGP